MRLLNAALAAAVASLVVIAAGLLYGADHKRVAWLAGVIAGLQPVYGSVAGAVNNDTAVNLAAAGLLVCLLHSWRRGLTTRTRDFCRTSISCSPARQDYGLCALSSLCRGRRRPRVLERSTVAREMANYCRWDRARSHVDVDGRCADSAGQRSWEPRQSTSCGSLHGRGAEGILAVTNVVRVEYLLQTFIPKPDIGKDHWALTGSGPLDRWPAYAIYVNRGYGLFGWKSVELSRDLLHGIFVWLVCGWCLAFAALVRRRQESATDCGGRRRPCTRNYLSRFVRLIRVRDGRSAQRLWRTRTLRLHGASSASSAVYWRSLRLPREGPVCLRRCYDCRRRLPMHVVLDKRATRVVHLTEQHVHHTRQGAAPVLHSSSRTAWSRTVSIACQKPSCLK